MAGQPSPSGMRCHRGGVADSKVYSVQRVCTQPSNPKPRDCHARDIRAAFLGRGEFQPSFFLPLFGPGKIPGEAFFCHGFGERWRRGGCWGCAMSAAACVESLGGGRKRRSAGERVRGSTQGREISLTRFVFFSAAFKFARIIVLTCRRLTRGVSSRRGRALRFVAPLPRPPWR